MSGRAQQRGEGGRSRGAPRGPAPFEGDPFERDQGGAQAEPDGEPEDQLAETEQLPPHRLLRFFDFTVEPSKRYRYKIRLALENPNLAIEQRFLEKDEFSKGNYRFTDWSEVSHAVTIPRDSDLLAVGAAKKQRGASGAKANVIARYWDAEQGIVVPHRELMSPGQVADFEIEGIGFFGPFAGGSVNLQENVAVNTDTMLLDVEGGEQLPGSRGRLIEPAEMLFLDAQGRLVMRDELVDQDEYLLWDELIDAYVEESTPRRRPRTRQKSGRSGLTRNLDPEAFEGVPEAQRGSRDESGRDEPRGGSRGGGLSGRAEAAQQKNPRNNRGGSRP